MADWLDEYKITDKDKQNYQVQQHYKHTGLRGIGTDIKESVRGFLPALGHMVEELPSEVGGHVKTMFTDPERLLKNYAIGGGRFVNSALNAPYNIMDYLKEKELIDQDTGNSIPRPPNITRDQMMQAFNMGETQPGDVYTQGLSETLPYGAAAEAILPKVGAFNPKTGFSGAYDMTRAGVHGGAQAYRAIGDQEDPIHAFLMTILPSAAYKAGELTGHAIENGPKILKAAPETFGDFISKSTEKLTPGSIKNVRAAKATEISLQERAQAIAQKLHEKKTGYRETEVGVKEQIAAEASAITERKREALEKVNQAKAEHKTKETEIKQNISSEKALIEQRAKEIEEKLYNQKMAQAERLRALQEQGLTEEEALVKQLQEQAPKTERANRRELADQLKTERENLEKEGRQRFEDVYNQPVQNPGYGESTLGQQQLPRTATKLGIEAGQYDAAMHYLVHTRKHNVPGSYAKGIVNNPTVKQSVELAKLAQQERLAAGRKAVSEHAPEAEQVKARNAIEPLRELEQSLWNDVENNVTPQQYADIRGAFTEWGKTVSPFHEHTILAEGAAPHGKIVSENAFEAINKTGADALIERIMQNPKLMDALFKHDLMDKDFQNPKVVSELLEGDFGAAIPEKYRSALEKLKDAQGKQEVIKEASKHMSSNEVKNIINDPILKRTLQNHPDLMTALDHIETLQRELEVAKGQKPTTSLEGHPELEATQQNIATAGHELNLAKLEEPATSLKNNAKLQELEQEIANVERELELVKEELIKNGETRKEAEAKVRNLKIMTGVGATIIGGKPILSAIFKLMGM